MLKRRNLFSKNKNKTISTMHMTIPEYVSAISKKVYDAWNDAYVAERINTKTIFDEGAKINNGLSFEELRECDARLTRAISLGNEFRRVFKEQCEQILNANASETERRAFFCATNIVNMISEINAKLPVTYPKEDSRDALNMEKGINVQLKIMKNIYTVNIDSTISLLKMRGIHMDGFL